MPLEIPLRGSPRRHAIRAAFALLLLVVLPLGEAPAQARPAPAPSPVQLSGVLFTHYRYGGGPGERSENRFDVERAYLNVRASLGDGLSARVTADVFQQGDTARAGYYRGWAMRAKYAYVQYDVLPTDGMPLSLRGNARLGIIGTVIVEVVDELWPRWISKSPVDRYDFMSSADVGGGVQLASAGGRAELYATVTNGEGYQRGETDRFKDYAARLTLRPLAGAAPWGNRLGVTPWISIGDRGSRFAAGPGTLDPVRGGLDRHQWGVFAGWRGTALTAGAEYAQRRDATESADTLVDVNPTFGERTTRVASAFVVLRPFALGDTGSAIPLGAVVRFDRLTSSSGMDAHANVVIAGLTWDLGRRVSLALDYQEESPHGGFPLDDTRTYFLHAVARF